MGRINWDAQLKFEKFTKIKRILQKIAKIYKNFTRNYQNLNKREDVSRGKREERGKG